MTEIKLSENQNFVVFGIKSLKEKLESKAIAVFDKDQADIRVTKTFTHTLLDQLLYDNDSLI